jgi:PilZ domain
MSTQDRLTDSALEILLRQAQDAKASASLRAQGSLKMLGDLHIRGMEPGTALHLIGVKHRDHVPEPGSFVEVSILLGDDVIAIEAPMLESLVSPEGDTQFPPILRVGWPEHGVRFHRRQDVRVAAPSQTPLKARLHVGGRDLDALLLNLTETGMGLALDEILLLDLHADVEIDTDLPGGTHLHCPGEVRHLTYLEGDAHPTRLGVVLHPRMEADLEPLRRFIQIRRTDRSEQLRQH